MIGFEAFFSKLAYHLADLGALTLFPFSEEGHLFVTVKESGETFALEPRFKDVMEHVMAIDAESLWPDMDPLTAKMSLFSVHVDEAVSLASEGAHLLWWGDRGLEARHGVLPPSVTAQKKV